MPQVGGVFSAPEHLPPPLPKIKRPQEEIDKAAERLATPRKQREATDGHMLAPKIVKTTAELEPSIDRLYTQSMDKVRRRQEKVKQDEEAEMAKTTKKISEEEVQDGVTRLYHRALESKKMNSQKLNDRHLFSPPKTPRKATMEECNDRVYKAALEKRKAAQETLMKKYVNDSMPHYRKITPTEVAASASRLSTPRGGNRS